MRYHTKKTGWGLKRWDIKKSCCCITTGTDSYDITIALTCAQAPKTKDRFSLRTRSPLRKHLLQILGSRHHFVEKAPSLAAVQLGACGIYSRYDSSSLHQHTHTHTHVSRTARLRLASSRLFNVDVNRNRWKERVHDVILLLLDVQVSYHINHMI